MGRSFDKIVAENQVTADTYAYRCLLEWRLLVGRERDARFPQSHSGQFRFAICVADHNLTVGERSALRRLGWEFSRDWRGGRGWSKNGDQFDSRVPAITEKLNQEAGAFFEDLERAIAESYAAD